MASLANLSREERIGLLVAAGAHVALAFALMMQDSSRDEYTIPERMDVSLATEVSLESTAPDPSSEPAAAMAPTLSDDPVAAPPPLPEPVVRPEPVAEPVRQPPPPRPQPTQRAERRPAPIPTPAPRAERRPAPTPAPRATQTTAPRPQPRETGGASRDRIFSRAPAMRPATAVPRRKMLDRLNRRRLHRPSSASCVRTGIRRRASMSIN